MSLSLGNLKAYGSALACSQSSASLSKDSASQSILQPAAPHWLAARIALRAYQRTLRVYHCLEPAALHWLAARIRTLRVYHCAILKPAAPHWLAARALRAYIPANKQVIILTWCKSPNKYLWNTLPHSSNNWIQLDQSPKNTISYTTLMYIKHSPLTNTKSMIPQSHKSSHKSIPKPAQTILIYQTIK